jgi:NAD(P) transhydrogenase
VNSDFDLVVIGAGPAGEKGAAQAAYFGKRVAIIDARAQPGGAAVHTGTLPSKTLREAALYLSGHRARELYGISASLDADATLTRLLDRKSAIIAAESATISDNLHRHGITRFTGHGRFVGANCVEVQAEGGTQRLNAEHILIATGSCPYRPSDIDFDDLAIHDSDEILHLSEIPETLIVLGAGVIGCEYACMFAALGCDVTLVDTRAQILPFLDAELVEQLTQSMQRSGIRFVAERHWVRVERSGDHVQVDLSDGTDLRAAQLLFAAGRVGATADLGLQRIGVSPDKRGYVSVDDCYRTAVPGVWAAGDVIGFPALASVSMEQGRVAMCHAFGFEYKRNVAALLPYGIYTIPEVSAVGETEQSCQASGVAYVVGRAHYCDNARGKITGDTEGFTKLVVDANTRKVIGVHVIGERATELVHIGQTAMHLGASVDTFIEMVFNYPSLAESYKYAAYACLHQLANDRPPNPPL